MSVVRSVRFGPVAVLALLILAGAPHAGAQAGEGFGVTPASLAIPNALAGETYARTFTTQNRFAAGTLVTIEPFGATGDWTSFAPASPFEVPAGEDVEVTLATTVPGGTPPGARTGGFRLVAAAKEPPLGTGLALEYALTVPLAVGVGTDTLARVAGVAARAEDVQAGGTPRVVATIANEGNVRQVARVVAVLREFQAGATLAEARASADVIPGQKLDVPLAFDVAPALGQYLVDVAIEGESPFARGLELKVFPPGGGGKSGSVRYVQHEPYADAGLPLKIVAVFENSGTADITNARFVGEIYRGAALVGTVESTTLVAPADRWVNFTAYFTPDVAGDYTVVGRVVYDGYETLPASSVLAVSGGLPAATPIAPTVLTFLIVVGAGGAAVAMALALKRRK